MISSLFPSPRSPTYACSLRVRLHRRRRRPSLSLLTLLVLPVHKRVLFLLFSVRASFLSYPFPTSLLSCTPTARGPDHVLHTRVHVRASRLRACVCVCVCVCKGSELLRRSRSSHTCSFFPRDRFAPQPPRASQLILGSESSRSRDRRAQHRVRTGLVAMILSDSHISPIQRVPVLYKNHLNTATFPFYIMYLLFIFVHRCL